MLSALGLSFDTVHFTYRQEKEESRIKKNLQTVLKDKEKIEQTIAELDRYKREALEKTWKEVDVYVII
jgi:chromosome segregation ATPase